jgi:hypothetical protein
MRIDYLFSIIMFAQILIFFKKVTMIINFYIMFITLIRFIQYIIYFYNYHDFKINFIKVIFIQLSQSILKMIFKIVYLSQTIPTNCK